MKHPFELSLTKMIMEAFEGPPVPVKESWFTDTEPNSGIFGALDGISADEASKSINGTTLAAHTDHVRYHMWGSNQFIKTGVYQNGCLSKDAVGGNMNKLFTIMYRRIH